MKIGVFNRLRSANSNNFEKWPTKVQNLDHLGIRQSNYCTGAPQASVMFHWGSAPPKRLKTTELDNCSHFSMLVPSYINDSCIRSKSLFTLLIFIYCGKDIYSFAADTPLPPTVLSGTLNNATVRFEIARLPNGTTVTLQASNSLGDTFMIQNVLGRFVQLDGITLGAFYNFALFTVNSAAIRSQIAVLANVTGKVFKIRIWDYFFKFLTKHKYFVFIITK